MLESSNCRILVIDDEEVVRDSIRLILASKPRNNQEIDSFAAELFEDLPPDPRPASSLLEFVLDEAPTGKAGLEMVRNAQTTGRPYAAVFVDMRMPGWDGLETVQHIREIDRQVEVVFVTAYSDHTIEDVVERAGPNVGYHLKPFAPDEIKQIATKAVYDWNKLRRLESLIDLIGKLKVNSTELDALLDHVFHQVIGWVGTDSALLAKRQGNGRFEQLLATGALRQESVASVYLDSLSNSGANTEIGMDRKFVRFQLERYDLVALLERSERWNSEKLYLLDLFIKHAGQAIENLRLHEEIMRTEKLAAVGLAIGKVAHDLRSPIGAIQTAVDLVRQDPTDGGLLSEMLDLMRQSSEEALALVADLLSFTKNSPASFAPLNAADLFNDIRQRVMNKLAARGISLSLDAGNVGTFSADRNKLQRALLNLIFNAAEALEAAGTAKPSIRVELRREGDAIGVKVSDNGPGIPVQIRSTIFEPFVTEGKADGTGLGLAIVRQAAEAQGGTVTFETSEAGTTFLMLLNQRLSELEKPAEPAVTEVSVSG